MRNRLKLKSRRIALLIALVGSFTCLDASSEQYSAAAITATVVDLETGKPLPGVHVVADWQLQGGMEGGNYMGSVKTMEQTTDDSGQFNFPAWGPIDISLPWSLTSNPRVQSMAPELILFKPGFKHERLSNPPGQEQGPHRMHSMWDGQTIKLKPFREAPAQYLEDVRFLSDNLESATAKASEMCVKGKPCRSACQWQNIPNTIRAVGQELSATYMTVKGYANSGILGNLIRNADTYRSRGCLSPLIVLGKEKK